MIPLRRRQGPADEEYTRLQREREWRQAQRDARAAARADREARRVRRVAEHRVRQEHMGVAAVNVCAEIAAITDRVAANEAKVAAIFDYMEAAVGEAGIPSRPRSHLRLIQGGKR
jgi:hypothetical protein